MVKELWWDDEDAEYIRHRSDRNAGAINIEPEDHAGITAWKTRGADLRSYLEQP